jgi:hypothetical protein
MMEKDCYIAFPAGRQEARQGSGASFRFRCIALTA